MSYISVSDSYDDDAASDIDLEGMAFQLAEDDGRTPLDRTIDRIGMGEHPLFFQAEETLGSHTHGTSGSYQWTLLCLCGFGKCLRPPPPYPLSACLHATPGWLADNVRGLGCWERRI